MSMNHSSTTTTDVQNIRAIISSAAKLLLEYALEREYSKARETFYQIRPWLLRSRIDSLLYTVAIGRTTIVKKGSLYLIDNATRLTDNELKTIEWAHQFVSDLIGGHQPVILLEPVESSINTNYSIGSVPGFGYVHINFKPFREDQLKYSSPTPLKSCEQSLAAHELAHCFVHSPNRFLNEGFATWVEAKFKSIDVREAYAENVMECNKLPALAHLLGNSLNSDHYFNKTFDVEPCYLYLKAAAFVDFFISSYGIHTLQDYLRHPGWSDGKMDYATIFRDLNGSEIKDFDNCYMDLPKRAITSNISVDTEDLEKLIDKGFLYSNFDCCQPFANHIDSLDLGCLNENQIVAYIKYKMLEFMALSDQYDSENAPAMENIYHSISEAMHIYTNMSKDGPCKGLLIIWTKIIELIRVGSNINGIGGKMILSAVWENLGLFRTKFPDDLELILCEAKFVCRTPREFGGGANLALHVLDKHKDVISESNMSDFQYWRNIFENHARIAG